MPTRKIPQTITEEEFTKVIIEFSKSKGEVSEYTIFCKAKWILQLLMILYMGLRPNEARLIQIKHIDFEKKRVFIPASNCKTKQNDYVPIPKTIYDPLWNYLKLRSKLFKGNIYLFSARGRRGFSDRNLLSKKFNRTLKKLRISKTSYVDKSGFERMDKNLYSLRHSFGTRAYEKFKDIRKTAIVMRHKDLKCRSTLVYIHTSQNKTREDLFKELEL